MTSPRRKKINFGCLLDPNPILKKLKEYDMTNKNKPGLKTEAAIAKFREIRNCYKKDLTFDRRKEVISLWDCSKPFGPAELIARFSLKDVILKRGPKRKKVKK